MARLAADIARRHTPRCASSPLWSATTPPGPLYTGGLGYASLADVLRELATTTLERATTAAGDGLRIERTALEGHAAEELVHTSADLDLLVVGSRGFGPMRRIVPGSTSAKVLRTAECPVLVLPRQAPERFDEAVANLAGATGALSPLA